MVRVVVETKSKSVTRTGLSAIWTFPRLQHASNPLLGYPRRPESTERERSLFTGVYCIDL